MCKRCVRTGTRKVFRDIFSDMSPTMVPCKLLRTVLRRCHTTVPVVVHD